jgi:hypothetical protein
VNHRLAVVPAFILVATVWLSIPPLAAAHDRPGPCDLHRQADESVRQHSKELIRCSAKRWEVPEGARKAICIADRESGLDPAAISRNRLYRGLFQHHKGYWRERYEEYTLRTWSLNRHALNGRTAAIVSIRMASDVGWGAWRGKGC